MLYTWQPSIEETTDLWSSCAYCEDFPLQRFSASYEKLWQLFAQIRGQSERGQRFLAALYIVQAQNQIFTFDNQAWCHLFNQYDCNFIYFFFFFFGLVKEEKGGWRGAFSADSIRRFTGKNWLAE